MKIEKLKGVYEQYDRHSREEQNKVVTSIFDAGGTIVRRAACELQLDIDSKEVYNMLFYKIAKFECESPFEIAIVQNTPSVSGLPKRHVTLRLLRDDAPVELEERSMIALQMYFGSDIYRELHNLLRVEAGCPDPCMFFEGVKWSDVVGR